MTHIGQVTEQIKAIPKERFTEKLRNTVVGLVFVGGAGLAAWKLSWPWYAVIPVAVFGGFFISQDLARNGLKLIAAAVRDVLNAVRGKSNAG